MAMEGNDFVDKSSQCSASKSKGAKDDSKFVRPLPVTTKAKKKIEWSQACVRVS